MTQILDMMHVTGKVVAVLMNIHTGEKRWFDGPNIVTDAGDLFYAQRGALLTVGATIGPVPTNFTDANGVPDMVMELFDDSPTNNAPVKGSDYDDLLGDNIPSSLKVIDATYPQVNDGDSDNTGAGVDIITYRVSYTTGEAINVSGTIEDVILTNPSPGAAEPLIMHATFAAGFNKTGADTLKVFINHRMNGV